MTQKESPEEQKYLEFINNVKENRAVWLLKAYDGLFAMLEDHVGQEYIPVWDVKDDAIKYSNDDWEGYKPESMKLNEFLSWLKELGKDEVMIAVAPAMDMKTIPLTPEKLTKHLLA